MGRCFMTNRIKIIGKKNIHTFRGRWRKKGFRKLTRKAYIAPRTTKHKVRLHKRPIGPNPLLNIIGICEGEEDGSVNHDYPKKS